MRTNRITKEDIIQTAIALVEEHGMPSLSMRELAERLGVKTPSLYNHIESMEQLLVEVCQYAVGQFTAALFSAMAGKSGGDAVRALAAAYRAFASGRVGLYRVIMAIPAENNKELDKTAAAIIEPFLASLGSYALSDEAKLHWQRVMRSMLHGFVSQQQAGFFSHSPVSADESFELAVRCILSGLRTAAAGGERND